MLIRHPVSRLTATRSSQCARARRCTIEQATASSIIHSRRYYASEQDQGKSFRGQLYESTAQRLQREKEEQARFREKRNPGSGNAAYSIGATLGVVFASYIGYSIGTSRAKPHSLTSTTPLAETVPPTHNVSNDNLQAAWSDFVAIVGRDNVSTEPSDLSSHSGSAWSSYPSHPGDVPFAIIKPASTEEVSKIMKICHQRRIPVTAYSGGTSLEGHFAATRGGICVDFSRMGKILDLHTQDLDVVVQPAVGWEMLNEELAKDGLFFPPDPGPGAMIGGMVGTGCSGTNAYRYGTMKDWVIGMTVVMADGTVVKTKQRPRKSSAGYDLTRTFIGSEGTLGLVTEATLKVTVKPPNESVAVCSFGTIRQAAECVFRVVGKGVPIAAIEILDDKQMKFINDAGSTSKEWKEAPTLFFKFSGTPAAVKENVSIVQGLAKSSGSKSFDFAKNEDERAELWSARKEALWSAMGQKRDDDHVWTTDVAVPISKLPDIIEATKEDMNKCGLTGSMVGHVGDGNFHTVLFYSDKEHEIAEDVVHRMVKRAIEMEGTATGEHGVGMVKRDYLEHELGPEAVDLMRKVSVVVGSCLYHTWLILVSQLKQAFDPLCLLNCDKVVRIQKPKPGEVQPW
ncbi:MAG: D-lactate ferricytochrome c oxidoreductase [Bogoriella megaspora]|nr:MAG: D-lactate ferricytochrome c oxidoreductase [Bogoriella megaspora]